MLKKMTQKLEALFEHEHNQSWLIEQGFFEAQKNFVLEEKIHSLKNLSYVFENEVHSSQLQIIVEQLGPHFEMALLFQKQKRENFFKPLYASLYGKMVASHTKWNETRFVNFPLFKVFRTSARGLFEKLKLTELNQDQKLVSYLIKVSPELILLVATSQAEPWVQIKIETLQKTLMKINFQS